MTIKSPQTLVAEALNEVKTITPEEAMKLDSENKVESLTFEGEGCAISLASASIMTELVKGKPFKEAKEIMNVFMNMIKSNSEVQSDLLND